MCLRVETNYSDRNSRTGGLIRPGGPLAKDLDQASRRNPRRRSFHGQVNYHPWLSARSRSAERISAQQSDWPCSMTWVATCRACCRTRISASGRGGLRSRTGQEPANPRVRLPQMRLYYVRLGFLASAYINQVGEPPGDVLPRNIAVPAVRRLPPPRAAADPELRRLRALTTGSGSTPPARSRWATSTRFRTSSISTTSTGSSWCTSRSRQIAAGLLAGVDMAAAASQPATATLVE